MEADPRLRQLSRWTCIALGAVAALGALAFVSSLRDYHALAHLGNRDRISLDSDPPIAPATQHAVVWLLAAVAVAGALFVAWMVRARQVAGITRGDAWVTLGWLPVVNLVVPYALVAEVHDAATRGRRAWWLPVWWLPIAAALLVLDYRLRSISFELTRLVLPKVSDTDIGTLRSTLFVDITVLGLLVVGAAGTTFVVQRISARLGQLAGATAAASH